MGEYKLNKYDYLPSGLIKSLKLLFNDLPDRHKSFERDYRSYMNCIKIVSIILYKQLNNDGYVNFSSGFVGISANYWKNKNVIGNHYSRYIDFLLECGIIERTWDKFYYDDTYAYMWCYRIKPELNDDDYVQIWYKDHTEKTSEEIISYVSGFKSLKPKPINLNLISIPKKDKAKEWVKDN